MNENRNEIAIFDYSPEYGHAYLGVVNRCKVFYVFSSVQSVSLYARTMFKGAIRVVVEPNDVRRRTGIVHMAEELLSAGELCVVYTQDPLLNRWLELALPGVYVSRLRVPLPPYQRRYQLQHPYSFQLPYLRIYVIDSPSKHRFTCRRIVASCHRYYIYSPFDESSEFPRAEQYIVQPDISARRREVQRCIREIVNAEKKPMSTTRLSLYTNDQHLHSTIDDFVPFEQRIRLEYFGIFRIRQTRTDIRILGLA